LASYYVAIDIPITKLASLGEMLLLWALLIHLTPVLRSNAKLDLRSSWATRADTCVVLLAALLKILGAVVYIYNSVAYNLGPPPPGGFDWGNHTLAKFLGSYRWINPASFVLYLLGAVVFAIYSFLVMRGLRRAEALCKALRLNIPLLAASFVTRSLVSLVFAVVFGLVSLRANAILQLIYMALYGPLTVTIYATIVRIAATESSKATTAQYDAIEQIGDGGGQDHKLGYVPSDETLSTKYAKPSNISLSPRMSTSTAPSLRRHSYNPLDGKPQLDGKAIGPGSRLLSVGELPFGSDGSEWPSQMDMELIAGLYRLRGSSPTALGGSRNSSDFFVVSRQQMPSVPPYSTTYPRRELE
jgi:hypothetical protein